MASLEYVAIPSAASRLDSSASTSDIRPAKRVLTSLPSPTPPEDHSSTTITNLGSPPSNTLSILPQLLLSGTLPSGTLPSSSTTQDTDKDGSEIKLLTTKDALSIPTTSTNFKRFVARAGPIFWFQDRVEEIVMWRRGWRVTGVWMAAYAFVCCFPRLILLLPHIALLAIILASYPYPSESTTSATPPSDSNVNWQANLQAIQNIMGLVSDTYDLIYPHTRHLLLSPTHFPFNPLPSHSSRIRSPTLPLHPPSPYPPYVLSLLILTFAPLVFVLSSPLFPLRSACLVLGLGPLACTHPRIRPFYPYIGPILERVAEHIFKTLVRLKKRVTTLANTWLTQTDTDDKDEDELMAVPLRSILERILDDDKLSDRCWRAEMRQVELWENERFVGIGSSTSTEDTHIPTSGSSCVTQTIAGADSGTSVDSPPTSPTRARPASINMMIGTTTLSAPQLQSHGGWSKSNLRSGERGPWTRRRDGWGGVGAEVSSNLTFSLAPGWSFVPTEGWRKDRAARWALNSDSESRLCSDGWVYTNDTWNDARPMPYQSSDGGSGSLTRRRRWVRRIWFDGSAEGGRMVW